MRTFHTGFATLGVSIATIVLAAPANAAPGLTLDRSCVNEEQPFGLTGTGFEPGKIYVAEPFGGKSAEFTADATGSFSGRLVAPLTDAKGEDLAVTVTEDLKPTVDLATTSVRIIKPKLFLVPTMVHAQRSFRVSVRGLTPGRPVWAHVRIGSRWVRNRQIGVATAPCGNLSVKTPIMRDLLRNRLGKVNFMMLQVDQSQSPSLTLRPAGTVNLSVRTPVGRRVGLSNVRLRVQTKSFRDVLPTPGLIP